MGLLNEENEDLDLVSHSIGVTIDQPSQKTKNRTLELEGVPFGSKRELPVPKCLKWTFNEYGGQ